MAGVTVGSRNTCYRAARYGLTRAGLSPAGLHQLSLAPSETSGYLPCTLDGEDAGFDLRFKDFAADGSSASSVGARDTAIACKWSGDPREEASALIVCAALAIDSHALVQRDGGSFLSVEQLLGQARAALD